MKKYRAIDIFWTLSLLVIAVAMVIIAAVSVAGYELPKAATVTLGVSELIAVFVLAFTTVRKVVENKRNNNN
ncbi:MAG: hypothetical protein OSJ74_03845 [Clostridia bacterium]|nr:hypothetical protein [Clostridia bacterium]